MGRSDSWFCQYLNGFLVLGGEYELSTIKNKGDIL